ncbi:acylphosphatase [Verrucomicrobiaceae bacterium 227]
MIAQKIIFKGRVQGVGFRYSAKQLALGFDVTGTVKNLSDGSVELKIMGDREEVADFIVEIVEESDLASLIKEHTVWDIDPLENCQGFSISD